MDLQTIGLGIDLIEYESFEGMQDDARFLKKVFTTEEVFYCRTKSDPLPYLAARFATKEAVIKALGQLDEDIFYSTASRFGKPPTTVSGLRLVGRHSHSVVGAACTNLSRLARGIRNNL